MYNRGRAGHLDIPEDACARSTAPVSGRLERPHVRACRRALADGARTATRFQLASECTSTPGVTVVTGSPIPATLLGRSSRSQRDTFGASVEMMTSLKP